MFRFQLLEIAGIDLIHLNLLKHALRVLSQALSLDKGAEAMIVCEHTRATDNLLHVPALADLVSFH